MTDLLFRNDFKNHRWDSTKFLTIHRKKSSRSTCCSHEKRSFVGNHRAKEKFSSDRDIECSTMFCNRWKGGYKSCNHGKYIISRTLAIYLRLQPTSAIEFVSFRINERTWMLRIYLRISCHRVVRALRIPLNAGPLATVIGNRCRSSRFEIHFSSRGEELLVSSKTGIKTL